MTQSRPAKPAGRKGATIRVLQWRGNRWTLAKIAKAVHWDKDLHAWIVWVEETPEKGKEPILWSGGAPDGRHAVWTGKRWEDGEV